MGKVERVRKRDGSLVKFNSKKIKKAISKASKSAGKEDEKKTVRITKKVVKKLNKKFENTPPGVEDIQDLVEEILIEEGETKTAKRFILYRDERKKERSIKEAVVGKQVEKKFSVNALKLLKERYLLRDEEKRLKESPKEMFFRVAKAVASVEKNPDEYYLKFYNMMKKLDFLPNSPTLMNAGTENQQLSSSTSIPLEDDLSRIFEGLKDGVVTHQNGGGAGFNFSKIRKENATTRGRNVAIGPVKTLKTFQKALEKITQGGKRQGGNIGILEVNHPDIYEFITLKNKDETITNFNISTALTDEFMESVLKDGEFKLTGRNSDTEKSVNAKQLFSTIISSAWSFAEPGVLFWDKIEEANPVKKQTIESTSPCGEMNLAGYESAFLGAVNLANFVKDGKVNWSRLRTVVKRAVRFLDNLIDLNEYPFNKSKRVCEKNRKIGLGVMGFAHMLVQLKIPYNSEKGVEKAEEVASFIEKESIKASEELAEEKRAFPNWKKSIFHEKNKEGGERFKKRRNASLRAISPTGSLSMIANTTSGIEPLFSISYVKRVMEGKKFHYIDPYLKEVLKKEQKYTEPIFEKISSGRPLKNIEEVSEETAKAFVTSHEISPEYHVKIQSAFQKHIDGNISKTINFPAEATPSDIEKAFLKAYQSGCRGITIYKEGSREEEVLQAGGERFNYKRDRRRRDGRNSSMNKEKVLNKSIRDYSKGE